MSKRQWTPQQQSAIDDRGGTLLLSAAAGSGKTAVLVERIVKLMTEGENPVKPSELLVVTFTNAAAAEMRARVTASIDGLISEKPDSGLLRRVKMALPDAQICTIDSFCIRLVRENFHDARINPDFTVLDNGGQKTLMADAMELTLDEISREEPEIYDMLNSVTSYGRDDSMLSEKIVRLYNYSLSHPFPDAWLESVEDMYRSDGDIKESEWGKIIIGNSRDVTDYCRNLLLGAAECAKGCAEIDEKYHDTVLNAVSLVDNISAELENGSWDEICRAFRNNAIGKLPLAPRGFGDNPYKLAAEARYKKAKEELLKCAATFCADIAENAEDIKILRPLITELISAVRRFGEHYGALKDERGSYTFGDIMHKALRLLARREGGIVTRSQLALSLQSRYREILIDEYQDTNEAQDMLFTLLSRDGKNMFAVGDVKQSIYRFRLAMPEIFVEKSLSYAPYDGVNYPAKIILGKNFRSRKGILDNINFLFKRLMSTRAGEMEYSDSEALYFGGGYPEDPSPCVELRFLENDSVEEEARYAADVISLMIENKEQVTLRDGSTRDARAGDFCILLRSLKGKIEYYENALVKKGIRVTGEKKSSLFDTPEISVFMSLLKIIDNPTNDIAMLSVMTSPLYGFTPDELALMKGGNKKLGMYSCVKLFSEKSAKAAKLIGDMAEYRRMSCVMPLDIFMRTLLDITGCLSIFGAMRNGGARRLNLIMLCSLASDYISNGGTGLGGFLRYISRASENGADIPAFSDAASDRNAVKIYSIHKSKGLEFPFVIIADCSKQFNTSDSREDMLISSGAGVGTVIINNDKMQKYSTLGHTAAKLAIKRESSSEELRILYVAMTRAKEKLIMISSVKSIDSEIDKASIDIVGLEKPSPCAVLNAQSYTRWLLLGFMTHPDMQKLLPDAQYDYSAESPIAVFLDKPKEEDGSAETEQKSEPDEKIISVLKEKTEYIYPYSYPKSARPKRTASDFEDRSSNSEYFASSKPSFLYGGGLTAAQIGTANHIFLQNLDFFASSAEKELDRMKKEEILTSEQARVIRVKKADAFLSSDLCRRIREADRVMREKEFTVQISLGEAEPDADENVRDEKVLILGKADLVIVKDGRGEVIDYKTDRSKSEEEFIKAYGGQIEMYKKAMSELLEIPVDKAVIYSLDLEKEIEV